MDTKFSIWFRKELRERRIILRTVMDQTGIHDSTMRRHFHGERNPSKQFLDAYADFFGMEKEEMYRIADYNPDLKYGDFPKHEFMILYGKLTPVNKDIILDHMKKLVEEQKFLEGF